MTSKEIELLSELTIVIPTYNRILGLEQAIEYWRDLPVIVHILDGSLQPRFQDGQIVGTRSIYYHHFPTLPGTDPSHNAYNRFALAASLPQTKYSVFCCDDDFYTISGLVEGMNYLEHDHEFDAVSGSILNYRKTSKNLVWNFHYRARLNYTSLETPSIETRVKNKANTWFLYAVCRTPIWKEFIKISYEKKGFTEDQHFAHEWLMFKLSKAMFRTKHLNTLTLIRQHTIEGANVGPKITWTDWLLDESNNHLIEEIEDQLMKAFNFVSSSADEENLKLAKSVMALERERVSSEVEPASNLKQRIKTIFVGLVFKVLPNLKVFSDRPHKLKDCWEMLDATGLSYERLELEFINELLLKPREELRLRVDI